MTVKGLVGLVGKTGLLGYGELSFEVTILDARDVFGRTDCLVEPVNGTGRSWVQLDRVKVRKT